MRIRIYSLLLLFMALSVKEAVGSEDKKKVLIYNPHIGYYHTKFMSTIAISLQQAGHDVTMLDSLVNTNLKNIERPNIKIVKVEQHPKTKKIVDDGETSPRGLGAFWGDLSFDATIEGIFGYYNKTNSFSSMLAHQCDKTITSDEFEKEIINEKYDLAITEVFDLCGVGLFHLLKNKPDRVILASSVPLHEYLGEMLGLPKSFDIVPTKFSISTSYSHREKFDVFSKRDLLDNVVKSALHGQNMFGYLEKEETEIFEKNIKEKNLEEFPGFKKLLMNAHSLMENVHPLLDLSKPTLTSIIPIGGITVQSASAIADQVILEILEKAETRGLKIVLVSFGTVMSHRTMKQETLKNLVCAFRNVTEAFFLWKVDPKLLETVGIETPDNVFLNDWMPQNDLLASGRINLFVSHMGIGSFTEAAYNGVPLVSIPIFVDQHYNYVCAIRLGIAHWVDKNSLATSSDKLVEVIRIAFKSGSANSSDLAKDLKTFGDQKKRMMDHINLTLFSTSKFASMGFHNHHHGFNSKLSFISFLHLAPAYAAHLLIVIHVLLVSVVAAIAFCCRKVKELLPERDAVNRATVSSAFHAIVVSLKAAWAATLSNPLRVLLSLVYAVTATVLSFLLNAIVASLKAAWAATLSNPVVSLNLFFVIGAYFLFLPDPANRFVAMVVCMIVCMGINVVLLFIIPCCFKKTKEPVKED